MHSGQILKISKLGFSAVDNAILAVLYIIAVASTMYRLLFGVEITDEIFAISEAYIILDGAVPIVDMWSQAPCFALLNVPLVWIYTFFTGSTEGIVLYFRIVGLVVKVIVVFGVCKILKRYIPIHISAEWLLPLVVVCLSGIPLLSYNTWTMLLMLLSGAAFAAGILSSENKFKYGVAGGISFALAILCYPTLIFLGVVMIPVIVVYEWKSNSNHNMLCGYIAGGGVTGLLIFFLLIVNAGGAAKLFDGVQIILNDNPYFKLPKSSGKHSIDLFYWYLKNWMAMLCISYAFVYSPILNKRIKRVVAIIFVVCYIGIWTYICLSDFIPLMGKNHRNIQQLTNTICRIFLPLPLILLPFTPHRNKTVALVMFVYLPALFTCMISSFSAYNGVNNRYYFMLQAVGLTVVFLYFIIDDLGKSKILTAMKKLLPASIACVLCIFIMMQSYGFVYRDEPLEQLTSRVRSGIYKNLYTTKARAEGIVMLENTLREHTSANDVVLFMDCVPMTYLMTEAKHCAPSTWDIQLYSYKFMEDTLLQKYFKTVDKLPDKIIYVYTGRDKILSIDNDKYKFNEFVREQYKMTFRQDAVYYPIRIYSRIAAM